MIFQLTLMSSPAQSARQALDAALRRAFNQTQLDVHVVLGNLRRSGHMESGVRGQTWIGDITYGNATVDYALLELERGGEHDFLRHVYLYEPDIAHALLSWIK